MADWKTLGAIHCFIGLEMCVLGMLGSGGNNDAQGCLISGMICYLVSVILVILFRFGDLDKGAEIAACIFLFVGAFLVLVGASIWGDQENDLGGIVVYCFTIDIVSSFMGLIAAVFFLLDLTGGMSGGGGGGGGGGSNKSKNRTAPKEEGKGKGKDNKNKNQGKGKGASNV